MKGIFSGTQVCRVYQGKKLRLPWLQHRLVKPYHLGILVLVVLLASLVLTPQRSQAALSDGYPEKMAIYYGDPAAVNGSMGNISQASDVFDDYDLVIFGEGIEQAASPYHNTTKAIIQNIQDTTRSYGYLDLCVENPNSSLYRCSNFTMAELQSRTDKWKEMGVKGIFLDQAGCDYVVSRSRLNGIVDYIHEQGLSAFVNVWNQDDAFSPDSIPSPYAGYPDCNPNREPTHLGPNDYSLLESWAVILSDWSENWPVDPNMLMPRGDKALQYKNTYGTKFATVNTVGYTNPPFEQAKFDYVWWTTVLYGFDAMAWGETWVYSADTNSLPFHPRPDPGPLGDAILPLSVTHDGSLHTRNTSAGYIEVDSTNHTGRFVYEGTPPPTKTPTATPVQNHITQPGSAQTDLISGKAVFNSQTITFTLQTNGAPFEYFHIYIDSDGNTSTGHYRTSTQGTTYTGVGADYMIENGYIYQFCGSSPDQVCWTPVSPNNNAVVTGQGTSQLQVTVSHQQINYSAPTVTNILAEHMTGGYATYDMLYRDPGSVWRAPTSGGSEPSETPGPTATKTPTPTATNTKTPGPTSTNTPTPTVTNTPKTPEPTDNPNIWIDCADEGETCTFSGTQQVRYGDPATGLYSTRNATNGIACNSATFGDPNPGATKSCQRRVTTGHLGPFSLIGWTQCAGEGNTCTFSGTRQVIFGNSGWFMSRTATGSIACNTSSFGDPLPGVAKICYIQAVPPTDPTPTPTITPTVTNAVTQSGSQNTDLIAGNAVFNAGTVTFTIQSKAAGISSYRIFIDRDNNNATGFLHSGNNRIGADYLVENGYLYEFSGGSQTTWGWSLIGTVNATGTGTTTVTVPVVLSQIEYSSGSTMAILAENLNAGWATLDLLLRSPGKWLVR